MKQLLFIFRKYHVLLVGLLLSTTIHAQDVEVNGICYNVDLESMQATVVAGDYAFKDINIPEQFTYGGRVFTVTTIGEKAFYCDNPQTASNSPAFATCIIIPHSVKKIENHAFAGTKYLKKFALPNSIDYIDAINSFTASDSIIIEDGVTDLEIPYHKNFKMGKFWTTYLYIGRDIISKFYGAVTWDYTFWGLAGCHDIETIEYGDNVSKPLSLTYDAGSNFIYGMNNLKTVIFGKNIEGMFEGRNVPSLTTIVSHNSVPRGYSDTSSGLFTNSQYLNIKIKVPKGSKEKYLNTEGWKKFLNIEEFDDTHIGPIVNPEVSTDDCLTVNNVTSCKGKTISISINLINKTANLTAYQFDLTLPTGILLATNDKGKYQITKTDRYEDDSQSLNVSLVGGNTYRIVSFSLSNDKISGTSGAILNAVLAVGENVETGIYDAKMSNIVFTKTDGEQLKMNDAEFKIVITNVIEGDANGDGEVNVADIVEVVNYILGKPSAKFVHIAADFNGDGEVNVTDIVKIVSIIMSLDSKNAQ